MAKGGKGKERTVTIMHGQAEDSGRNFPANAVITSKYTCVTFLPLNLWEQLHKFGNCYFLAISVVMYLGEKTPLFIGTIKAFSTLATLLAMMAVTAIMALLDDRRRSAADEETNNQEAHVVHSDGGIETETVWEEVVVGDMLVVRQDEEFPADMVCIYSAGDEGNCYVSTANLDGETNLKLKSAAHATLALFGVGPGKSEAEVLPRVGGLSGSVRAEAPTTSIHDFRGTLQVSGSSEEPLGQKQFLLRGTVLRNTAWCLGVVVYTGKETRMVMNSKPAPLKQSNLERVTNRAMFVILGAMAFMAVVSDVLYLSSESTFHSYWYLYPPEILLPSAIGYWLTFFVLYSNLMPISLYPTMECCNAAQAYFIKNDRHMYYKELNFPAGVRSSNLCQEIGQIGYIFSDKTGTLTQNVMELKRLSIAGRTYGELEAGKKGFGAGQALAEARRGGQKTAIDDFLEVLAVAHTVMAQRDATGKITYEAESPDEGALVEAVAELGWAFDGRKGNRSFVQYSDGGARPQSQEYQVVAVNAFDSTRKRMSVVVKKGSETHLLVKGADNVMMERANRNEVDPQLQAHLDMFAREGLRTLVIGRRALSGAELTSFQREHEAAERDLNHRDELLAAAAEKVETQLKIVGATAIEDKLQDEVPETIVKIREAGIKLWVLTGDKLETARNIGFSSKVLTDEMCIETLDVSQNVQQRIEEVYASTTSALSRGTVAAMMVTGSCLKAIQDSPDLEQEFLDIAERCSVVIACRVSPLQKAEMVKLVRECVSPTPVTLAVGDGANDVPMIQQAQVGVGIAGREGRQAVNNSDFSIGQFKYLQRLLLLHGRWNYRRVCKFTLFTFWRNAVQVLMIFYYTFISGYSGTSLFEDWVRMSFNFLCSFPIIATGCFDQDVSARTALENPQLYKIGRKGLDLTATKTAQTLIAAIVHSMILLMVTILAFPAMDLFNAGDYYTFGTAVFSCLIVDMNYRVLFLSENHNWYTVGSIVLSFALYILFLIMYPCWKLIARALEPNMYMVPYHMASNLVFWFCILATPLLAMIVDVVITYLWHLKYPDVRDHVWRHIQEKGEYEARTIRWDASYSSEDESDESDLESDDELEEAISMSRFAQQRLPSYRLRITASLVIKCCLLSGLVLLLLGSISWYKSQSVSQLRVHYAGDQEFNPIGTRDDEVVHPHDLAPDADGRKITINAKAPRRMEPPILVYYAVGPFYQNFHDFLDSEVEAELEGKWASDALRERSCPKPTREAPNGEKIYPCGMKATSVFNDTFEILGKSIDRSTIAWDSDVDRFANPPEYPDGAGVSWLPERYPLTDIKERGVKSERFASWMRPSAVWRVWNQYGWIHDAIEEGEDLTFYITSDFPTDSLGASKQLVLTTLNSLGGRHNCFGISLVVSSALCFVAAVVVWCASRFDDQGLCHDYSDDSLSEACHSDGDWTHRDGHE